jgi:hypothetical protein
LNFQSKSYIDCSDNSSNEDNFDVVFKLPTARDLDASTSARDQPKTNATPTVKKETINTCKVLQRKLELKVERAKKNYNQLKDESKVSEPTSKSSTLMPITRLPIPGVVEQQPLVEYKSENSDNDEFDVSFFPHNKTKSNLKIDLTDTFSIQEMTIESDCDTDDSQNLELLSPMSNGGGGNNLMRKLRSLICCTNSRK